MNGKTLDEFKVLLRHIIVKYISEDKALCFVIDDGARAAIKLNGLKPSEIINYFHPKLPDMIRGYLDYLNCYDSDEVAEEYQFIHAENSLPEMVKFLRSEKYYNKKINSKSPIKWVDVEYDYILAEKKRAENELYNIWDYIMNHNKEE